MKVAKIGLIVSFYMSLLIGCANDIFAKEKLIGGNVLVNVTLNKIKYPANETSSYIYGTLKITGKGKSLKSANLDCIGLSSSKFSSEKLYIDSIAHVLTSNYQAKNNEIRVDVYWLFSDFVQRSDLAQFEISLNTKEWSSCVTLE